MAGDYGLLDRGGGGAAMRPESAEGARPEVQKLGSHTGSWISLSWQLGSSEDWLCGKWDG